MAEGVDIVVAFVAEQESAVEGVLEIAAVAVEACVVDNRVRGGNTWGLVV